MATRRATSPVPAVAGADSTMVDIADALSGDFDPSAPSGGDGDAAIATDPAADAPDVAVAPAAAEPVAAEWPCRITVRNNGDTPLVDPASGAFVSPGSAEVVTLHDLDHANMVVTNLRLLASRTGVGDRLVIEGLKVDI